MDVVLMTDDVNKEARDWINVMFTSDPPMRQRDHL
jgi:hypothetical protein